MPDASQYSLQTYAFGWYCMRVQWNVCFLRRTLLRSYDYNFIAFEYSSWPPPDIMCNNVTRARHGMGPFVRWWPEPAVQRHELYTLRCCVRAVWPMTRNPTQCSILLYHGVALQFGVDRVAQSPFLSIRPRGRIASVRPSIRSITTVN